MWHTHWRLRADPNLPAPLAALLDEHFCAWSGGTALPQDTLATIGRLDADADVQQASTAPLPMRPLPGAWPGPPIHRLVHPSGPWGLRCGDSLVWVQQPAEGGPARVLCQGIDAALPLLVVLTELFRADGWLTLHASAFQASPGQTQLCLGRSGAGKSVRALAQTAAGARFMGEDRLWLRAGDLLVVPRDRRVRLLPQGAGVLGGLPLDRAARDADGKWRLPLDLLGLTPGAPAPAQGLDVLLGVRVADPWQNADTGIAARHLAVLQALWEAAGTPFLPAAQAHTSAALQRLARLPANLWWRTRAGVVQPC